MQRGCGCLARQVIRLDGARFYQPFARASLHLWSVALLTIVTTTRLMVMKKRIVLYLHEFYSYIRLLCVPGLELSLHN